MLILKVLTYIITYITAPPIGGAVTVMIVSVPIITKAVSLNPAQARCTQCNIMW